MIEYPYTNCNFINISFEKFDVWLYRFSQLEIKKLENSILSFDKSQRSLNFLTLELQIRFLQTRIFVRKTLAKYVFLKPEYLVFTKGMYGRPALYIQDLPFQDNIFFNISHKQSLMALAVSREKEIENPQNIEVHNYNTVIVNSLWQIFSFLTIDQHQASIAVLYS